MQTEKQKIDQKIYNELAESATAFFDAKYYGEITQDILCRFVLAEERTSNQKGKEYVERVVEQSRKLFGGN